MMYEFASRAEAARAVAGRIRVALLSKLANESSTSLIVTGGSSPQLCYELLAEEAMPWERVQIFLSDERWVDSTDERSNEKMVRERLLVSNASDATLHGYYQDAVSIAERCASLTREIEAVPNPLASCLLGMGSDGHIASLFSDSESFAEGISIDSQALCLPVHTRASDVPRLTLTLPALVRSEEVLLLFFGDEKRDVYQQAVASETAYPVSRLLHQTRAAVSAFWAP